MRSQLCKLDRVNYLLVLLFSLTMFGGCQKSGDSENAKAGIFKSAEYSALTSAQAGEIATYGTEYESLDRPTADRVIDVIENEINLKTLTV